MSDKRNGPSTDPARKPFSLVLGGIAENTAPNNEYNIIVYGNHPYAWGSCDYNGHMDYPHPGVYDDAKHHFIALSEDSDTRDAWVGETIERKDEYGAFMCGKVWWD